MNLLRILIEESICRITEHFVSIEEICKVKEKFIDGVGQTRLLNLHISLALFHHFLRENLERDFVIYYKNNFIEIK